MKRIWSILLVVSCLFFNGQVIAASQLDSSQLTFVAQLSDSVKYISIDGLNNIYVLNQKNFLIKYDGTGKKINDYNDVYLNEETIISCENPFKTVLYYPDQGKLKILDNRLSVSAEIDIYALGLVDVAAVCPTKDNQHIWVFDEGTMTLYKISQSGKLIYDLDMRDLPGKDDFSQGAPVRMIETNSKLFMINEKAAVYIFDNFGNFNRKFNFIAKPTEINATDEFLIYKMHSNIVVFSVKNYDSTIVPVEIESSQIVVGKGIAVARQATGWNIYKF